MLTCQSLTSKKLPTALTCSLPKNGQSGTLLLSATNHGVNKPHKTTHGTTTSRSYQMRKDSASSLPQSLPDHNAMHLPVKLADLTKVIIRSYPPLILRDMWQEWDLCTNNTTQPARRTISFTILKHRRRRQFLLHLLLLVGATSTKARNNMHQHARQNARQTQISGIELCQQPIWQRYTSILMMAPKMSLTSISLLTLTKMIE